MVAPLEPLNAASFIYELLFPCIERMTTRTNRDFELRNGGASYEGIATSADYRALHILRVNPLFHSALLEIPDRSISQTTQNSILS